MSDASDNMIITTDGTGGSSITITWPNVITWPNTTYPSDGTSCPQPTYEEIVPEAPEYPVYPTFPFYTFDPEKEELKERLSKLESLLKEMMDLLETKLG